MTTIFRLAAVGNFQLALMSAHHHMSSLRVPSTGSYYCQNKRSSLFDTPWTTPCCDDFKLKCTCQSHLHHQHHRKNENPAATIVVPSNNCPSDHRSDEVFFTARYMSVPSKETEESSTKKQTTQTDNSIVTNGVDRKNGEYHNSNSIASHERQNNGIVVTSSSTMTNGHSPLTTTTMTSTSTFRRSKKIKSTEKGKYSSTIGGSFVRSLTRSVVASSSTSSSKDFTINTVSQRKSILNSELSAYDLIKRQLASQDPNDSDLFSDDDDDANNKKSMDNKKSNHVKNVRIGGQGVTLFPWESKLLSIPKLPSSDHTNHKDSNNKETTTTRVKTSSSLEQIFEPPKYHLPEPDYDLSDEDVKQTTTFDKQDGASYEVTKHESTTEKVPKSSQNENVQMNKTTTITKSILKKSSNDSIDNNKSKVSNIDNGSSQGKDMLSSSSSSSSSLSSIVSLSGSTSCSSSSPSVSSASSSISPPSSSCETTTTTTTMKGSITKTRKTAMNMMKLKLMKRNRKHVTFRSYKDDSLILEHINEPIPEEDESDLYDDIHDPIPVDKSDDQSYHRRSFDFGSNPSRFKDDELLQEVHNDSDLPNVIYYDDTEGDHKTITTSSSSSPLITSTCETRANARQESQQPSLSSVENQLNPTLLDYNKETTTIIATKTVEGTSRRNGETEMLNDLVNDNKQRHNVDDDGVSSELQNGDDEDNNNECDNENEYYDHFPEESTRHRRHPFTVTLFNDVLPPPIRQREGKGESTYLDDDRVGDEQVSEEDERVNRLNQRENNHHAFSSSLRDNTVKSHNSKIFSIGSNVMMSMTKPVFKAQVSSTSKSNKIVIDVPSADAYDGTNGHPEEHIYEEIVHLDGHHGEEFESLGVRSMFDGATKDDILEYLEDAKERVQVLIDSSNDGIIGYDISQEDLSSCLVVAEPVVDGVTTRTTTSLDDSTTSTSTSLFLPSSSSSSNTITASSFSASSAATSLSISTSSASTSSSSSVPSRRNRSSNVSNSSADSAVTTGSSSCTDDVEEKSSSKSPPPAITRSMSLSQLVERNDSGIGAETTKPSRLRRCVSGETEPRCNDCDQQVEPTEDDVSGLMFYPSTCSSCEKKRSERKEIISEFVDTEFKYGRDLRIIKEEFFRPLEVAGLMTKDQLRSVFVNLDELIYVNSRFSAKLADALDAAIEQGDEDFTTVNLGKLFMNSSVTMLHAFETYCSRQGTASFILTQLEKEKELLRIFLRVSQMENTRLRRMNLSAFLMVPVQRVTKYPLLLSRLLKVTPVYHPDQDSLRAAHQKVEFHLEHINQQTKSTPNKRIWKRIQTLSRRFKLRSHLPMQ